MNGNSDKLEEKINTVDTNNVSYKIEIVDTMNYERPLNEHKKRYDENSEKGKTIIINGLTRNVFACHLYEVFNFYGRIKGTNVPFDRQAGRNKGYGFVEFHDSESADKAVRHMNKGKIDRVVVDVYYSRNDGFFKEDKGKSNPENDILKRFDSAKRITDERTRKRSPNYDGRPRNYNHKARGNQHENHLSSHYRPRYSENRNYSRYNRSRSPRRRRSPSPIRKNYSRNHSSPKMGYNERIRTNSRSRSPPREVDNSKQLPIRRGRFSRSPSPDRMSGSSYETEKSLEREKSYYRARRFSRSLS